MKINVPLDNGYLPNQYTKHADAADKDGKYPVVSFPISFSDVPESAKSLAIVLLDDDAIPVCGFTYIHWVCANLDPTISELPANASQSGTVKMTYGHNSLAGGLVDVQDPKLNQHYVGPTPPDKTHNYHVYVYALDEILPVNDGFWLNELKQQMNGHIVGEAEQVLPVKA